jgi:hypothetical protein
MVWLLLLPCILCTLISMNYDDLAVPILGLLFFDQYPRDWARLIPPATTMVVFLTFTYFANGRSYSIESTYKWAWFPIIGSVSLTACEFVGNYLNRPFYGLLTLPLAIAVIVVTVVAAISSRAPSSGLRPPSPAQDAREGDNI